MWQTNGALGIFLASMIVFSKLVDKVFACRICPKSYGFSSRTSDGPYFKFPPIIGKTHDAELLFVGINPRISRSNRSLHHDLMRDKSNFLKIVGVTEKCATAEDGCSHSSLTMASGGGLGCGVLMRWGRIVSDDDQRSQAWGEATWSRVIAKAYSLRRQ
jgi:hypothetical protein